jgi:hypothetical protein
MEQVPDKLKTAFDYSVPEWLAWCFYTDDGEVLSLLSLFKPEIDWSVLDAPTE